jgi:hypothetical protein
LTAHPDAIVIMPLLNLDELYGPGPVGMNLVMQPIFDAASRANIDPARVYLIGHSMAAHAVWNLAIHYPTYFAAINPFAGSAKDGWQRYRLGNLANILCIVWHDASDEIVRVSESRITRKRRMSGICRRLELLKRNMQRFGVGRAIYIPSMFSFSRTVPRRSITGRIGCRFISR